MRFCVSVPVLSALSCVALPMVSHASSLRTRFMSSIILRMANASPSVMASGRPSGMATTTMVTASMKKVRTSLPFQFPDRAPSTIQRIMETTKVRVAMTMPNQPMLMARRSRRSWSGVFSGSTMSCARIWPHSESRPTAMTSASPQPSPTVVPEMRKGSRSGDLGISMLSPVMADSSVLKTSDVRRRQSAGSLSPAMRRMTSPTTMVSAGTARTVAERTTQTV
mmetsp:Transcript_1332/g.3650  ORF Transcript_1332/g.3650 Transcript_1332/m.3650 type:complete len:223 (-) Transcript_1332:626-1294(-)